MTGFITSTAAALAAGAVALAGALDAEGHGGSPRTALVIDAAQARHGRELVDPRLRDTAADVRLPRTPTEARTNVRYFDALGYRVVVSGPEAGAAAAAVGVDAEIAPDLPSALEVAAR